MRNIYPVKNHNETLLCENCCTEFIVIDMNHIDNGKTMILGKSLDYWCKRLGVIYNYEVYNRMFPLCCNNPDRIWRDWIPDTKVKKKITIYISEIDYKNLIVNLL